MRYNDRITNSLKNKELNRFNDYGFIDSTIRSENRRKFRYFEEFEKEITKYFNRDMWFCIDISSRKSLYNLYKCGSIEEFAKSNKIDIEKLVDKSLYRDKKLNKIFK